MEMITVASKINAPLNKVWQCWTEAQHVEKWNFASDDWHCPKAANKLVMGGEFHYEMAAKDGSANFDFWGTYTSIETEKLIEIVLGDERKMAVSFEFKDGVTTVTETFEPENINSIELQKTGWQAILDNFKQYVENYKS